jgi:hypothetical protein
MCNPAAIMIGTQVAQGAAGARANYLQGKADEETLAFQRDAEKRSEVDAVNRGAGEAGRARTAGTEAVSQNKVALAASGVDVQSGTALDILADTRALSELEVQQIKNNAAREAWGHKVQAQQFEFARKVARKNRQQGLIGSFLGTAAQGASTFAMGKK